MREPREKLDLRLWLALSSWCDLPWGTVADAERWSFCDIVGVPWGHPSPPAPQAAPKGK